MSQRRRLPNSLRWRAVRWMEMGLSQADAARRLNVSRSVVQRVWDQYQSEDSVSEDLFQADHELQHLQKTVFLALSARRRRTTTVPQLVADHFQASGRRISATTVRNRLHNAGLYARRPVVCVPLNGRQRRNRLCWARENMASTDLEEQRTRYHQSNTVERHSYRGGGILVWAGISLGGHTDLHVFHGGTVTGLRYRDEILDPYVRPYAAAIGNDFILMDDNARPHRAQIVEEYLEDHGLERMEWPARSPDLNPIEHLWDYLGREVTALNPPPRSLHELKQGLLCVWSSLPIPVSDNLINSMGNRCRKCIQIAPKNEEKNSRQETPRTTPKRLPLRYRQDSNLMNPLRQFWWNNIYPAPYSNNLYCDRSIVEQGWMPMDSPFFNSQTFIKREPGKPENNENCYIKNTMNENQPSDSKINNNMYFLVVPGYSSPQSHDIYANPGYYGGIIPFSGLPFRDFHSNVSNIGTFPRRMPTNFGSESQKDHQYAKGMSLNNETINNNICAEEIYNEQLKNFQMLHQNE
ncbi:transposable element Tcb2 transposase [Trichonephila clavipes]|nr:transposable element Tcb2 transposase [Trichonephila clavipes]